MRYEKRVSGMALQNPDIEGPHRRHESKRRGVYSSVQSLSRVWLFVTPWTAAHQASLSITNSRSLLKFISVALMMPSNHLILCHPLLLMPSIFPSIRVFSNELVLHIRWPKYWSFSFSISLSNEFRTDFLSDWLVGSPCSPRDSQESSRLQSSKASILQCSDDYWKNHSFHEMDLCWQSNVSTF